MPTILPLPHNENLGTSIVDSVLGAVCRPSTSLILKAHEITGSGGSHGLKSASVFGGEDLVIARVFDVPPLLGFFALIDGASTGDVVRVTNAVRRLGFNLSHANLGGLIANAFSRVEPGKIQTAAKTFLLKTLNNIQSDWYKNYKHPDYAVNASIALCLVYTQFDKAYVTTVGAGNSPFYIGVPSDTGTDLTQLNELHEAKQDGLLTSCITSEIPTIPTISTNTLCLSDLLSDSTLPLSLIGVTDFNEACHKWEAFSKIPHPNLPKDYLEALISDSTLRHEVNNTTMVRTALSRLSNYNLEAIKEGSLDDGSMVAATIRFRNAFSNDSYRV